MATTSDQKSSAGVKANNPKQVGPKNDGTPTRPVASRPVAGGGVPAAPTS